MIWLSKEEHAELLEHPAVIATDAAASEASKRAKERGTVEALAAHQRAAEAAYWLAQDLSHEIAQRGGRADATA